MTIPDICYYCGQPATAGILTHLGITPCHELHEQRGMKHDPKHYSISQAADILKIHVNVLSRKLKYRYIAGKKVKGQWRIEQREIDRLMLGRYELNEHYMSLQQAADALGIHYQTAWEWLSKGKFLAHRDRLSHGQRYFVSLKEVETLRQLRDQSPAT